MNVIGILVAISLVSVFFTGCASTGEPVSHLEQCHVRDGLLVATGDCIEDHNAIVSEIDAKRRLNRTAKMNGPARLK